MCKLAFSLHEPAIFNVFTERFLDYYSIPSPPKPFLLERRPQEPWSVAVHPRTYPREPPCQMEALEVDKILTEFNKSNINSIIICKMAYQIIFPKYIDFIHNFTNGSKSDAGCG